MMGAIAYRFRAEARRTWISVLAVLVVVGIVGGAALASIAGARRTESALPRLLSTTNAHHVVVNPDHGSFSDLQPDDLDDLPGVVETAYAAGVFATPADADGNPDFERDIEPMATDGRWGYEMSTPVVRDGRMPDPGAEGEILVDSQVAAWYGVGPGDRLPHVVVDFGELQEWEAGGEQGPPPFEPRDFDVVGVADFADQVVDDLEGESGRVMYTAAYLDLHRDDVGFWGGLVRLADPTRRAEFEAAVQQLVPDEAVAFHWTAASADRFQRAVRPQAVALGVFGAILAVAAVLGAVTALARHSSDLADERRLANAMGLGRRSAALLGASHGAVVAVGASAVAVGTALALSPVFPIGPARDAEPTPGFDADLTVVLAATVLMIAVLVVGGAVSGSRSLRSGRSAPMRPSRAAAGLAALGAGPVPTVGARMAFEKGSADRAVPVTSTMTTLALAVAAVMAAGAFGESLDRVITTPALYGSNWDAAVSLSPPADEVASGDDLVELAPRMQGMVDEAVGELAARPDVDGITVGTFAQLDIGGRSVPALGLDVVTGAAHPTIVDGRRPTGADEVVLGGRTMRQLGVKVGERAPGRGVDLVVVGRAVFPGYAEYSGQDSTELGTGAWMTVDGLARAGNVFAGRTIFVSVEPGGDVERALVGLEVEGLSNDGGVVVDTFRPVEVDALERVRSTPDLLALGLGAVGALAASHALLSAVRRRRRDLAVLRVLGMRRRDIVATISCQASLVAGTAIAIGVPFGVAVGRWSWSTVVETLGGVARPVTPVLVVVVFGSAVLVAANLLAASPSWRAARLRPADVLRAE